VRSDQETSSLRNTLVAFTFLYEDKNYQRGSIVFGVGGDEHFAPRASIIDPRTGSPLAYLELRDDVDENELNQLAKSYAGLRARDKASLPVYLLRSVAADIEPRILALSSKGKWVPIRKEDFPSFEVLSSLGARESAEAPKRKSLSATNEFKRASQLSAFLLIALLVLDFCHMISITQNHLWLLLGAAVMIVLPYFSIIKVLGLELQRDKGRDDKERT
jgi:hypothetical protein